ncbi:hypothetical protein Q5762_11420 [Streptomyces sp. P9(2023)]|uniref:hypothetical protein n=1 Tax=Streptomyces sp. P9(2023) TaxID=3064394 RepID=UPI0028F42DC1|nr:hypothetical protein [Streptomyces sp. P9(2023)]MDT9688941.1 hypothetical protein [Streptomyces sp. P9(2023)]
MDQVAARQVPLPADVAGARQLLDARLDELVDKQPLVVREAFSEGSLVLQP